MKALLKPWQLLLVTLAGWINHREQEVIEYLRAENRVLREKLGKKRILIGGLQMLFSSSKDRKDDLGFFLFSSGC